MTLLMNQQTMDWCCPCFSVYTRKELAVRIGYLFVSAALAGACGVSPPPSPTRCTFSQVLSGTSSIRYWQHGRNCRNERVGLNSHLAQRFFVSHP